MYFNCFGMLMIVHYFTRFTRLAKGLKTLYKSKQAVYAIYNNGKFMNNKGDRKV